MKVYIIKEDKSEVQDYYSSIISSALAQIGYTTIATIQIKSLSKISKKSIIISISHYTTLKAYIKGFRNILYWVQGSSPDESFMRNHSYFRKAMISIIEFIALNKAKYCFMVSNSMLNYYNTKYRINFTDKTYIMPCYNSEIKVSLFNTPDKYNCNTFCYVGGLSVWQCFPETVDLYKKIEERVHDAFFKVFTGDIEKATKILEEKNVKNYNVKYVKPDDLVNELATCKYGFIVRENSPVNYVATPTKLSNYMAAGLIPIVSNTVGFFSEIFENSIYSIVLNGSDDINKILELTKNEIQPKEIAKEYSIIFGQYYNTEKHISNIANKLKKIEFK